MYTVDFEELFIEHQEQFLMTGDFGVPGMNGFDLLGEDPEGSQPVFEACHDLWCGFLGAGSDMSGLDRLSK